MAERRFRGIFGITPTPFHPDERLDTDGLESVIDFTVEAGAHGLVTPVMASEYHALTDRERRLIVETAVRIVDGRVPVVAGVTGVSTAHSVALALHAQDTGADAVIAMPPHGRPPTREEAVRFFHVLGESLSIPVFIQNHATGFPMDAPTIAQLCREAPNVEYVKEETAFAGQMATRVMELAGDACKGVMGGMSCRYLVAEHARGECGNMPSSHLADVMSAIWNRLESGDTRRARDDFNRVLPVINFENQHGAAAFKEILVRRGVIKSATVRSPGKHSLDRYDQAELDVLLADIDDLMTWRR